MLHSPGSVFSGVVSSRLMPTNGHSGTQTLPPSQQVERHFALPGHSASSLHLSTSAHLTLDAQNLFPERVTSQKQISPRPPAPHLSYNNPPPHTQSSGGHVLKLLQIPESMQRKTLIITPGWSSRLSAHRKRIKHR